MQWRIKNLPPGLKNYSYAVILDDITHTHYIASPEIVILRNSKKLVIIAMIFRNTINIAENRVGGLESTAEQKMKKQSSKWMKPQRAINFSVHSTKLFKSPTFFPAPPDNNFSQCKLYSSSWKLTKNETFCTRKGIKNQLSFSFNLL